MVGWFKGLSTYRKALLFLSGGMLTLVFDAFIAHYHWNTGTMRWNQWIPIVYGLVAFAVLSLVAVAPLASRVGVRLGRAIGGLGMVVGSGGIFFHAKNIIESIDTADMSVVAIGKTLASSPPLFAPAAFAGVGLLLVVLPSIVSVEQRATARQRSEAADEVQLGVA